MKLYAKCTCWSFPDRLCYCHVGLHGSCECYCPEGWPTRGIPADPVQGWKPRKDFHEEVIAVILEVPDAQT